MKKQTQTIRVFAALLIVMVMTIGINCSNKDKTKAMQTKIDSLQTELKKLTEEQALTAMRLVRFDSLDFDVYSNQKWNDFAISHDNNIKVYYPDGSTTVGLNPQHINALKPMFVFAPDTKIKTHPVKFGSGDWTAVIGEMEGTFSRPMPIGNEKTISPTGKKFKIRMATIGHWKNGKMIEEYLFWDNQAFMNQIGLGK